MGLRLILVSAVAGLGLSLPNGDDLDAWSLRVRDWMVEKLAEWDAPGPEEVAASFFDADAFDSTATDLAPAPAPAAPSNRAEQTGAAFDAVQEEMVPELAADPDPTPVAPAPAGLLAENTAASIQPPALEPDFDGIQEEIVAGFLADDAPDALAPESALAEAEPKPATDDAPKLASPERTDDLVEDLADRLNREAEGIAAEAATAAVTPRSEQWAEALRLTREAAFAWANLLNAPAVASIER
jgi:hypothetical protein